MGRWRELREGWRLKRECRAAEVLWERQEAAMEESLRRGVPPLVDPEIETHYWFKRYQWIAHEARVWDLDLPTRSAHDTWLYMPSDNRSVLPYLNPREQQRLLREIKKVRREYYAFWAQTVANVGTVLIGILSLLVALVTLLMERL